ncbi:sensor histidine kinase [Gracilibacillus thailandensis]|uniref:Histidine kinase/HSP90-like ATPase domain-containing protein n=1 Tax=Gracilibacillus thailandensis TaxID=563735 RepID=A0A6N7QXK2_9BACI|nr:ATP-binding protein [Gracilibacillus thailandensis]MRI65892.1 hypothetical protein [Gracilibacillus thailandensis]
MKTLLNNSFNKFTLLLSILLLIYFAYIIIKYPLVGIVVSNIENSSYKVIETHPVSWSNYIDIEINDRVLLETEIDDREIKIEMVQDIFLQDGQSFTKHNINYSDTSIGFALISILPIIVCIINIIIAGYLLKKYQSRSINLLAILFLNIGLTYISASISARDNILGLYVNSIGLLLCPVVLLHFLNELNYEKAHVRIIQLKHLNLFYIISIGIVILDVLLLSEDTSKSLILYTFSIILFIICIPIFKLVKSLQKYVNKYKLKLFYYGLLLAFLPFISLYIVPFLVLKETIISAETTSLFVLAVPFMGVYIMLVDVLPDIDYQVDKLIMVSKRSFFPAIFISFIAFFLISTRSSLIELWLLIMINLISFSILLFFIDSNYKLKREFDESFLHFSIKGRSVKSKNSLIMSLTQEIEQFLDVPKINYFIYHQKSKIFCSNESIHGVKALTTEIHKSKMKLEVGQLFNTSFGYFLIVGIIFNQVIFFFLPYKKGIIKYNRAEKYWLRTLSIISQNILENLESANKIVDELEESLRDEEFTYSQYSRLFLLISERESKRISMDIHDTLLQEIIFLCRSIGDDVSNQKLLFIKERLLDQVKFIRESCYELNPVFINQFDFIEAINNLILTYKLRENMEFKLTNNIKNYNLTEHQMICFYRIIQELLMNAVKHSRANSVSLTFTSDYNNIHLEYEDDGIGLNIEKRNSPNHHFGLLGIKHRVKSMDGKITFSSSHNGLDILISVEKVSKYNEKKEELF